MKARIRENSTIIKESAAKYSRTFKRKYTRKTGMTMEQFEKMFEGDPEIILETITEGSKVKLKYDFIMENKQDKSELWLDFVEKHKDDILTVEYDERHKDRPTVFCLKEDTNPVKWLFDISELEVIEMVGGTEIINVDEVQPVEIN